MQLPKEMGKETSSKKTACRTRLGKKGKGKEVCYHLGGGGGGGGGGGWGWGGGWGGWGGGGGRAFDRKGGESSGEMKKKSLAEPEIGERSNGSKIRRCLKFLAKRIKRER